MLRRTHPALNVGDCVTNWKKCIEQGRYLSKKELKILKSLNIIASAEYKHLTYLIRCKPNEAYEVQKNLLYTIAKSTNDYLDLSAGEIYFEEDLEP